jgi:hypothetical protein
MPLNSVVRRVTNAQVAPADTPLLPCLAGRAPGQAGAPIRHSISLINSSRRSGFSR